MTRKRIINIMLTYLIAAVWLVNGLFCKVLNLVPRHQQIVAGIMGIEYASILTKLIGVSEVFFAIWIVSKIHTRLSAITQIIIITAMNTLEFILVSDLLLWGKWNALFAFIFILIIYWNEFVLNTRNQ